jgi:transposase
MIRTRTSDPSADAPRLTDQQWAAVEPFVPACKAGGRPAKYTRRAILDAILYALRRECTWRDIPPHLPHWNTAFCYYREWRKDGTWDGIETAVRLAQGRDPHGSGTAPHGPPGPGATGKRGGRRA